MEQWVIIGSGGFVEGSVLPFFKKGLIKGIITHNPVNAFGLIKAYNIKIYSNLKEAKSDGCNVVYICSSNWTHLEYIKEGINLRFKKVISEKPIILSKDQIVFLREAGDLFYGSMIKRKHSFFYKNKNKDTVIMKVYNNGVNGLDYIDPRRGNFLLVELIHFIDLALLFIGNSDFKIDIEGNRINGKFQFKSFDKTIIIIYDFNSDRSYNDLFFYPELIKNLWKDPKEMVVFGKDLVLLYETIFNIQERIMSKC